MADLEEMRETARNLLKAARELEGERMQRFDDAMSRARANILADLQEMDRQLAEANAAAINAEIALRQAAVEEGRKAGMPWPEGTLVTKTHIAHGGVLHGIIEFWSESSEWPRNQYHAIPESGTPVVRLLLANGKPGKVFHCISVWSCHDWEAEDGTPPKLQEKPEWMKNLLD